MPKDQLDAGGSKQALPDIPVYAATVSAGDRQGSGSNSKHYANAKERYSAPGKVCRVALRKGTSRDQTRCMVYPCFPKWICKVTVCPPSIKQPQGTLSSIGCW